MRWFKHMTTSRNDPDMRMLLAMFGYEGYGAYWMILEMISENLKKETEPEATMTLRQWCNSGAISQKKFEKILSFLENCNKITLKKNKNLITIKCDKILKYRDEFTSRGK